MISSALTIGNCNINRYNGTSGSVSIGTNAFTMESNCTCVTSFSATSGLITGTHGILTMGTMSNTAGTILCGTSNIQRTGTVTVTAADPNVTTALTITSASLTKPYFYGGIRECLWSGPYNSSIVSISGGSLVTTDPWAWRYLATASNQYIQIDCGVQVAGSYKMSFCHGVSPTSGQYRDEIQYDGSTWITIRNAVDCWCNNGATYLGIPQEDYFTLPIDTTPNHLYFRMFCTGKNGGSGQYYYNYLSSFRLIQLA